MPTPLRITYLSPFFDPATQYGGPVAMLRRLCQGMARRGHFVRVITTDLGIGPKLPRHRWLERDGYRVWYGEAGRLAAHAPHPAPLLRIPLDAALPDTDLLHLHLGLTLVNVLGRRRARVHGVPYVYTPHGVLGRHHLQQRAWSKRAFLQLYERRVVRGAAALHALVGPEREDLLVQGAKPTGVHVIPNGVDMGEPARWPSGDAFRQAYGIASGVPVVLFLGRLQRVKGLDVLIEAFARVRQAQREAVLVLAGPDEGAGKASKRLAERCGVGEAVRFPGRLDDEAKLSAFRAASLFALTSRSEGLPMAALEACAMGVPALLSERCNLPEVAEAGAGRVVPGSVPAVAAAMRDMLADGDRLAAMGRRARQLARERFAAEAVEDRFEALYQQVVSEARTMQSAVGGVLHD